MGRYELADVCKSNFRKCSLLYRNTLKLGPDPNKVGQRPRQIMTFSNTNIGCFNGVILVRLIALLTESRESFLL